MCPGLWTCHETPGDMWHYSVTWVTVLSNQRPVFRSRDPCCPIRDQYSGGGKCHCPGCYGGMWPQSGPIVPPRPQVARQNILWEQRLRRDRGDLTVGGVLIKLNFIGVTTLGRNDQLDSLMAMFKGIVIKMKLSFVPTWAHHVFADFCRLSTEPKSVNFMFWWENSHRFLYLYFSPLEMREGKK